MAETDRIRDTIMDALCDADAIGIEVRNATELADVLDALPQGPRVLMVGYSDGRVFFGHGRQNFTTMVGHGAVLLAKRRMLDAQAEAEHAIIDAQRAERQAMLELDAAHRERDAMRTEKTKAVVGKGLLVMQLHAAQKTRLALIERIKQALDDGTYDAAGLHDAITKALEDENG